MKNLERKPASPVSLIRALARRGATLFRPSVTLSRETMDAGVPDEFRVDCCVADNTATAGGRERENE